MLESHCRKAATNTFSMFCYALALELKLGWKSASESRLDSGMQRCIIDFQKIKGAELSVELEMGRMGVANFMLDQPCRRTSHRTGFCLLGGEEQGDLKRMEKSKARPWILRPGSCIPRAVV